MPCHMCHTLMPGCCLCSSICVMQFLAERGQKALKPEDIQAERCCCACMHESHEDADADEFPQEVMLGQPAGSTEASSSPAVCVCHALSHFTGTLLTARRLSALSAHRSRWPPGGDPWPATQVSQCPFKFTGLKCLHAAEGC